MSDDLVKRVDSLVVLLNMERKKSLSLGKHIEKLEAALLWYAEHCQKGGDDIEGPYGDYGERARKALEGKDD